VVACDSSAFWCSCNNSFFSWRSCIYKTNITHCLSTALDPNLQLADRAIGVHATQPRGSCLTSLAGWGAASNFKPHMNDASSALPLQCYNHPPHLPPLLQPWAQRGGNDKLRVAAAAGFGRRQHGFGWVIFAYGFMYVCAQLWMTPAQRQVGYMLCCAMLCHVVLCCAVVQLDLNDASTSLGWVAKTALRVPAVVRCPYS